MQQGSNITDAAHVISSLNHLFVSRGPILRSTTLGQRSGSSPDPRFDSSLLFFSSSSSHMLYREIQPMSPPSSRPNTTSSPPGAIAFLHLLCIDDDYEVLHSNFLFVKDLRCVRRRRVLGI
ncbi:uncharacterized protein STEHIDRAFT_132255 [Stereum hirsutum FP-91666 SS1]|uniref:uncharacterized protein n=1 Tax=Stereum hirsutum (strain FP-91666) TaxID=721885 RepID=UPI0004449894|nr:uncharacterized protein STEHIDRAFT_132255 [Stereum hirsutum FP-91666 SS1]EIM84652.1 hypothetical protein STEHIDRAFT_132255 [Stereum hirsutum FP-91666 SS1]